jgi:curved DNA-binding protein CbpA
MESYYDLLGVPPHTATTEQINAAYRRVSKAYHPDLGATGEKMKRLNDVRTTMNC